MSAALYYYPIFEPAHFVMESGMMMGIKQRAERAARAQAASEQVAGGMRTTAVWQEVTP